jgi:hypothetical protein
MLPSDNYDLTGCQKQPSSERAVWGDAYRPTAAAATKRAHPVFTNSR